VIARRSPSSPRTARGELARAGVSPARHASTHGSHHTLGIPPPIRPARSLSVRGRRPGASAINTRPSSLTANPAPAQSQIAFWVHRNPRALVRATNTTRGRSASDGPDGQA